MCKQDILTLFVTLFSTCKVENIIFKKFNLPLTFKSNGTFRFCHCTYNLSLIFQKKLYHIIWSWKSTLKISSKVVNFWRLEMKLIMKSNSMLTNICIYLNVHHINIEGWKKETIICKKLHILSSIWNLFFKLPKIKGSINLLTSALEKIVILI
jgi:hypothetical protein